MDQHFTYTFQTFRKVSKYVILQMEGWSVRYSRQSQQDKKQSDVPCFHLVILVYKIQTSLPLIWEWLFLKFRVRCFPCSCSNLLGVFWLDCVWSCCPPRFCFLAPRDWWFRISPVVPDPNRCAKAIMNLNKLYRSVAEWLTEKENHECLGLVSHRPILVLIVLLNCFGI